MKSIFTCFFLFFITLSFTQNFDVYVSDAANFQTPPWQILKYDQNGENPSVFIKDNLSWPQEILFLESEGTVLISNFTSNRITRHDAETGAFINNFATFIAGPTRLKIGPDSLLYVLQWNGNGKVRRYELDGTYLGEFTSVGVSQSIGLDWDTEGNLYVSSYNLDLVRKFDRDGNDLGVFINSGLVGPTDIWFDDHGDLLVSDYDGTAVKRFDSNGNYSGDFLNGLSRSEGVAYLPDGNILIGNGATSSIKMFSPDGNYIKDFIPPRLGGLQTPNAITVRMKPSSSVKETESDRSDLIYPTIGSEFRIQPEYAEFVKYFEVYSFEGKLVETLFDNSWDASKYAVGVYLITATFNDGARQSQKVVVRK